MFFSPPTAYLIPRVDPRLSFSISVSGVIIVYWSDSKNSKNVKKPPDDGDEDSEDGDEDSEDEEEEEDDDEAKNHRRLI